MVELEINTERKHMTLEQAITEGKNALIPYEFDYPNSDFVVDVQLRPVTSRELSNIDAKSKVDPDTTVDLELLKVALLDLDGNPFPDEIITKLPAGIVIDLSWKICDISGIDFNKIAERQSSAGQLEGF